MVYAAVLWLSGIAGIVVSATKMALRFTIFLAVVMVQSGIICLILCCFALAAMPVLIVILVIFVSGQLRSLASRIWAFWKRLETGLS